MNHFTKEDEITFTTLECRYVVFGREVGESGTPHLQGYLELDNAKTLSAMKKIHEKAHWEARRGTPVQADEYCRKGGDVWSKGELPKQGRRTDLEGAVELVQGGVALEVVAAEMPAVYVKYHKGLRELRNSRFLDRSEKPVVSWLWGKTGVGKTRTAVQDGSFYIKDATRWWDGYEQQEVIVIDDFDGTWPFRDLLRLLDRYPYQGQTKGGYVKINSPKVFITCDRPPTEFWSGHELEQLNRRLDSCLELH